MSDMLDHIDRGILARVQVDCTLPSERIADEVGISPSAVQRRLKRMRETGVILSQVAVLDPRKLGNPLSLIAALEVEREKKELLLQLRQWLNRAAEVQQAFYVTGAADIILVVICPDMQAYDEFSQRLVEENRNVRRVTTSVSLQVYKRGLSVPV